MVFPHPIDLQILAGGAFISQPELLGDPTASVVVDVVVEVDATQAGVREAEALIALDEE